MATNKTLPTVIGIGLVASVIAIALLLQPREPRQLQPAMTQAWTDLLVCLRGPALHDGELLTQRLRSIELAGARDKGWPQRCVLGEAPPMLKAILEKRFVWHELVADAAVKGDRRLALQALMIDEMSIHPDKSEQMLDELLNASKALLPQFFG